MRAESAPLAHSPPHGQLWQRATYNRSPWRSPRHQGVDVMYAESDPTRAFAAALTVVVMRYA